MTGWVLVALPLFIIVGSWFSKEKGTKYGFVGWLCFFAMVACAALLSKGWGFVLAFALSVVVSLTGCVAFYRMLSRSSIGKTLLKHDHDGAGIALIAVTFILLMSLTMPLFSVVFVWLFHP